MKQYDVVINGIQTSLQLSDEDAKAQGLFKDQPKAKDPANKSTTPANKSASPKQSKAK